MSTIVLDRLVSVLPAESPESAATVLQAAIEKSAKKVRPSPEGAPHLHRYPCQVRAYGCFLTYLPYRFANLCGTSSLLEDASFFFGRDFCLP